MVFFPTPINVEMKTISMLGCFIARCVFMFWILIIENIQHWFDALFALSLPGIYWIINFNNLSKNTHLIGTIYIAASVIYFLSSCHFYYKKEREEKRQKILKELEKLKNSGRFEVSIEDWERIKNMKLKEMKNLPIKTKSTEVEKKDNG